MSPVREVPLRVVVGLALLALAAAGCSAKKAATSTSPTPPPSPSLSPSPSPTPPSPSPSPSPSPVVVRPTTPAPVATAPAAAPGGAPPASAFPLAAGYATALAFAPDGRLFWAERAGRVMVYENGGPKVFASVRTPTTEAGGGYSERGLLGLAISPTFATDHYVYAFFSNTNLTSQQVVRWTDSAGTGTSPATILTVPSGGDCCHKGGRLAFGPDHKLYVTLGEEHDPSQAQVTTSPLGKLLRYNPDGSIPADDPFAAQGSAVWASGFRNPFGIAIAASGQIALTVNGPTGDDGSPSTGYDTVIASVARGGDYQWPECYGYGHPLEANPCPGNLLGPDWSSEGGTAYVPTGATFVDAAGPAGTAGHLVFCSFSKGGQVFSPGSPHGSVSAGPANCNLDVKQGPDHALYYSSVSAIYRQG